MRYFKEKGKRYMALLMVCVMMMGLLTPGVYADASPSGTAIEALDAGSYINFGGRTWRLAHPATRYLVMATNYSIYRWSPSASNTDASNVFNYLNTAFDSIISVESDRDQIDNKVWNIGAVTWANSGLADPPLATSTAAGAISPASFEQKLGLISLAEWQSYKGFIGNPNSNSWTRVATADSATQAWGITPVGGVDGSFSVNTSVGVRPALYLNAGITIAGGSGTSETPYTLANLALDIGAAKVAIEGATYTATQSEAGTAEAAGTKAQALVNDLELVGTTAAVVPGSFTAAVAGTSGTPAGTNGAYTFTVTINKGGGTHQTSAQKTMTITATAYDPAADNTAIGTAKGTIESATYTATQAEAGTADAAETKAQALVNALELVGTTAEVVPGSFAAAVAGTSGTPAGTNGAYTFTVTINKGGGTQQISAQKTMSITATPNAGISDVDAVAAAKIAIETALSNLSVSNATTANDILTAATNATLHGVSVAWNGTNGFSKTNATSSAAGSITGTLNLTLNSASGTVAVNKSIAALPSTGGGGGGGGSTHSTPQQPGNTIVTVNGEPERAGTETQTNEAGKSVVNVKLDNQLIESKIDEAIKTNTTGTGNVIQVPVADTKSDVAKVELTGDIVKKLEESAFDVSVKRDTVEYIIPAEEFTISRVAENLGLKEKDLADIKVEVKITRLDEKSVERYNEAAKVNGAVLVFPPVSFEVVAKTTKTDGSTGEVKINTFSKYVERVLEIPAGVGPSSITTGIVFNPDGTYSHVPTEVFQKDEKWYARINSLTNSNYSVIQNPLTVKSVENHWSKAVVNDLASRLVIFNSEVFAPDQAITRADFAEYMVRALGLYREGSTTENGFTDVSPEGARTRAILIANANGIVSGYPDGTFRPDGLITREEAMAMYQRAMKMTKLVGTTPNRYQTFTDYDQVGTWATNSVKEALSAHIVNGTTATTISPKSNLTYAEAVQAIKNLLVESKLINK